MENTENKKSFSQKLSNFFTILSIRLQLLLIWAEKNLSVLLKTLFIVIGILIITNVVDGHELLILFGVTQSELNEIDWDNLQTVENILTGAGGLFYTLFVAFKRTKKIALEDIKSRKLKIKLIKSNLYFDENNNLCKRVEEETNLDINGDNKIGDNKIISNEDEEESLLTGIPRATTELFKVMTTKITLDETKVVEKEQLNASPATEEKTEDGVVVVNEKLYTEVSGEPEVKEEETEEEYDEDDEEYDDYTWIDRLKDFMSSFKITFGRHVINGDEDEDEEEYEETEDEDEDSQDHSNSEEVVEEDTTVEETQEEIKVEEQKVETQETHNTTPVAMTSTKTNNKGKSLEDLINGLRG